MVNTVITRFTVGCRKWCTFSEQFLSRNVGFDEKAEKTLGWPSLLCGMFRMFKTENERCFRIRNVGEARTAGFITFNQELSETPVKQGGSSHLRNGKRGLL